MLPNNHRFTMLSADDVALCRAHSRAVASEPDHVVWARECGAPTTQQRAAWSREETYRAACDDFERVTLNQAQSDAYWQWQREVHAPTKAQIVDEALKTLASAKPAATGDAYVSAKQPESSVEVWHSEAPPVAGVYAMDHVSTETRNATMWCAWFDGAVWHRIAAGQNAWAIAQARREPADTAIAVEWTRLIEADKPAQQPAQKASTHSVCIKEHGVWKVGEVTAWTRAKPGFPECWLPCDESGWVTHVPKRDSVCPVPDDINYEAVYRDGSPVTSVRAARLPSHVILWRLAGVGESKNDIIAWRPIAQR